jgi:hypothetical protein
MNLDHIINCLTEARKVAKFGGQTAVYACVPEIEYQEITDIKIDNDSDGCVILIDTTPESPPEVEIFTTPEQIQAAQGWTDKTLLDLVLRFVNDYGEIGQETLMDCLMDDLTEEAKLCS